MGALSVSDYEGGVEPHLVRRVVECLIAVSGRDVVPYVQGEGVPQGQIDGQFLDSSPIESEVGSRPVVGLEVREPKTG